MTDRSPTRLEACTPSEIRTALDRNPRLLLAVGPLENHGPDLPVGTGYRIASAVVEEASARTGVLRAPGLAYGVAHSGWDRISGLTTLRRKTLHRALNDLLAGWEDHGVHEFVLVTAHSSESHLDALLMALNSHSRTTVFDLGSVPVEGVPDPGPLPDPHALDRSVLYHLDPGRIPETADAATYAAEATSGEVIFERWVEALVAHLGPSGRSGEGGAGSAALGSG